MRYAGIFMGGGRWGRRFIANGIYAIHIVWAHISGAQSDFKMFHKQYFTLFCLIHWHYFCLTTLSKRALSCDSHSIAMANISWTLLCLKLIKSFRKQCICRIWAMQEFFNYYMEPSWHLIFGILNSCSYFCYLSLFPFFSLSLSLKATKFKIYWSIANGL